jgi:micrococcal nuclease
MTIAPAVMAETLMGQVTAVTGGDTLKIVDARSHVQLTVRIAGIEAPDRSHRFGGRAQQNLGALASGRDVRVESEAAIRGNTVFAKIMATTVGCQAPPCQRDMDVGLEQVRAGLAWWALHSASGWTTEEIGRYQQAEFQAKIHRRGLWAGRDTFPPWQTRPISPLSR